MVGWWILVVRRTKACEIGSMVTLYDHNLGWAMEGESVLVWVGSKLLYWRLPEIRELALSGHCLVFTPFMGQLTSYPHCRSRSSKNYLLLWRVWYLCWKFLSLVIIGGGICLCLSGIASLLVHYWELPLALVCGRVLPRSLINFTSDLGAHQE